MNQFIATGTLITALRSGKAANGDEYLQFLLRCPRSYSGKKQKDDYDIFDCFIYNEGRRTWAQDYLVKGQRILVKGEIRTGRDRQNYFVLVEHIEFAGSSRYKEDSQNTLKPADPGTSQPAVTCPTAQSRSCIRAGDDKDLPF